MEHQLDKVLCIVQTGKYPQDKYQRLVTEIQNEVYNSLMNDELAEKEINKRIMQLDMITRHIIPVHNLPHSDKENGQPDQHYHIDTRYMMYPHETVSRIFLPLPPNQQLKYFNLAKVRPHELTQTPVRFIAKSKLKHKCIHKGKCPHRGFDLTGIEPVNGIITCPLHSLQFDSKTKKLINF